MSEKLKMLLNDPNPSDAKLVQIFKSDGIDVTNDMLHRMMIFRVNNKNYLLFNGDVDDDWQTVRGRLESLFKLDYLRGSVVTCSWVCLWRMLVSNKLRKPELNKSQFLKLQKFLSTRKFEIIDLLDDDIIYDNSKECKNLIKHPRRNLVKHPHKFGYTYMGNYRWHRAGSMCFKFDDSYYVMGMDDGSYFCSQLPKGDKPKTVQEALDSLRPNNVPKGSLRQGEWFAVPVKGKDVPKQSCLSIVDDYIGLPAELNSNIHYFEFNGRNKQDHIRVWDNEIFVLGNGTTLWHEEHPALVLPKGKWFKFVRNTAVRSVSVTGVD